MSDRHDLPRLPILEQWCECWYPLLDTADGYWARAGRLRATVLAIRRKARLGDALIAQSCLVHRLPLLTRDRDFMAFADAAGLDLVVGRQ